MSLIDLLHQQHALRDVDRAFADLLRRLGASAETQLAGAIAMRALESGHSGFALEQAGEVLESSARLPDTAQWRAALLADPLVSTQPDSVLPLCFQHGVVALNRYARYEQDVADAVHARSGSVEDADDPPEDRQALAAWRSLHTRLLLLSGGPGTGKTTTVARLLALHLQRDPELRIALAAPTGRAAARMAEAVAEVVARDVAEGRLDPAIAQRIPRESSTLHRLLGWHPDGWRHGRDAPLPQRLIVVDEASMIDLPLMARLFAAIADDATLVLIGDPSQLPAVEAGDVFGALCDAAGDDASGSRVHLEHSHRQRSSLQLAPLTDAIRAGDGDAVLAMLDDDAVTGVQRIPADAALVPTLTALGWIDGWRALATLPPEQALRQVAQQRVLTALRRGSDGAPAINAAIEDAIAGPQRDRYYPGRLLLIDANDPGTGLFNGDIGICQPGDDGEPLAWFIGSDGLRAVRPSALPAHSSAFATTVHKAQGSEFESVFCVLPRQDSSRILTRELLYTALTRARASVYLQAGDDVLRRCVSRQQHRFGALRARLAE